MIKKTLSSYGESLSKPVVDYKNPNCSKCNECCTITAAVSKIELKMISRYIGRHRDIKDKVTINISSLYVDNTINLYCPFSDTKTKKCLIYKVRPAVCRGFHCSNSDSPEYKKTLNARSYIIGDLFGISHMHIASILIGKK